MSFLSQQVPWMPSPPLAPGHFTIDLAHLRHMTIGDARLEREVLQMFKAQSADILSQLAGLPSNSADLAHTLKGSARAIGAFVVGDAAQELEHALRTQSDVDGALQRVTEAVSAAADEIDAILGENE